MFFYFSKLWFWWLLVMVLAAVLAWWLGRRFRGRRKPQVDERHVRELADARSLANKHESKVNELLSVRARELDELTTARGQLVGFDDLHAKIRTLEADAGKLPTLQAENRTLKSEADKVATLTAEIAGHRARIGTLEGEAAKLAPLQRRMKELEGEAGRAAALTTQVATLQASAGQVAGLQARITELERESAELAALRARIAGLEGDAAKLRDAEAELNGLRGRVGVLESEAAQVGPLTTRIQALTGQADRVGSLTTELAALRARAADLEGQVGQVAGLQSRNAELQAQAARAGELERELAARPTAPVLDLAEAGRIIGSPVRGDDLEVVEGIGPKIAELLRGNGITTWAQLAATDPVAIRAILHEAGPNFQIHDPGTWPHQAALLAWGRWTDFKHLTDELAAGRERGAGVGETAVQPAVQPVVHPVAAQTAEARPLAATTTGAPTTDVSGATDVLGMRIKVDDLKVVEGIGPKIEELLHADGIRTWRQLAAADPAHLKQVLDAAGTRFQIHDPSTWPRQAELLADAQWVEFKAYTDHLQGGRE